MALIVPTSGSISQGFGCTGFFMEPAHTWHGSFCAHFHGGIDYAAPTGTVIRAAANGFVRETGTDISIAIGGGIGVWLQHSPTFQTVYAHCDQSLVSHGQQVLAGQTIARVGSTGNTTGPHLHFAVWTDTVEWGFEVDDPNKWLPGGSSQNETWGMSDDIPWLEPLTGTIIRNALFIPQQNGSYAAPSSASRIAAVYYDGYKISTTQYLIYSSANNDLFIFPKTDLAVGVEVRGDYIA
jgi:hypothetical protein